jgi:hypothetical protein
MTDYKAMYYHLAGRMAGAVEALEAIATALKLSMQTTEEALAAITTTLKLSMQATEEMFMNSVDDSGESE